MNKTAITAIHPAAACPDWCTARDAPDHLTTWPSGDWDVVHEGAAATIETEDVDRGVAVQVSVFSDAFACNVPSDCRRRSIRVAAIDSDGDYENFALTARQALRLAEALVQQAAAILTEETTTTVMTVTR